MTEQTKYLISISGPTAIGKTGLAIFLANQLQTEIISCDSRQFYKEMKIGTAVPTKEELQNAVHHFIQHLSIFDTYTVGDFEREAIQKIETLFKTKNHIIMVGGSGLFEKAVTQGLDEFPEIDPSVREKLNQEFQEFGLEKLQLELQELDPDYFQQADIQNPVRIIRALEICRGSGKTFSSFRTQQSVKRNFKVIKIGLELDRQEIYDRINKRVDLMMEEGLLKEAESLYQHRNLNSLQTVGYRELFDYFDGKFDLDFAISEIKKNSRRYAKRQLTWYRKDPEMNWFSPLEKEQILAFIQEKIKFTN